MISIPSAGGADFANGVAGPVRRLIARNQFSPLSLYSFSFVLPRYAPSPAEFGLRPNSSRYTETIMQQTTIDTSICTNKARRLWRWD